MSKKNERLFNGVALAKQIKIKRTIDNNYSLGELALITNISKATLSRMENGKTPDIITLYRISKWLNAPMDKFIIKSKV